MSKFRVNDLVCYKASNLMCVVKGREVVMNPDKTCEVQYIVKPCNSVGIDKWIVCTSKDLKSVPAEVAGPRVQTKTYDMPEGYKLTLVSLADRYKYYTPNSERKQTGNWLTIGWALCSPLDTFDEKFAFKFAKRRAKKRPFCKMDSPYSAEFDENTVAAIMDAKANYVASHMDCFIKQMNNDAEDATAETDENAEN